MTALREEALQIVNGIPDHMLIAFLAYLKNFNFKQSDSLEKRVDDEEFYSKRKDAIAAIKEWQERNRAILESGIDWNKELELAMEEKYGRIV